jgi:hypothetical protein
MRILLLISLLALLIGFINEARNPFPQFSEKELQFICQEELL